MTESARRLFVLSSDGSLWIPEQGKINWQRSPYPISMTWKDHVRCVNLEFVIYSGRPSVECDEASVFNF